MGVIYQQNSSSSAVTCTKDADCYAASTIYTNGAVSAATTTAEKAKRCCMYFAMTTEPSGTNKTSGDFSAAFLNLSWGLPLNTESYTTICNMDYPATIPIKGSGNSAAAWDAKTNVLTYTSANGGLVTKQYCDGSASALAVAGTAVVAAAVSMY